MNRKIRLLLADDHAVLRAGLRTLLNGEPDMEVVGEAADGREAVQQVDDLRPDVVIMDITMPVMSGLEATRQVKRNHPDVKVLVLTMHDGEEFLSQTLGSGGSGYLPKKAADTDLIDAIRTVHDGGIFVYSSIDGSPAEPLEVRPDPEPGLERLNRLTEREKQVLGLVAKGHTNVEIARLLVISVKTVETHRANLMEKLGFRTRAELVRYALQRGMLEGGG